MKPLHAHSLPGAELRGRPGWVLVTRVSGRRENVPAGAEFVEADVRDPARAGELQRCSPDRSRLPALGWYPAHTLHEGLADTFAYIRGSHAPAGARA